MWMIIGSSYLFCSLNSLKMGKRASIAGVVRKSDLQRDANSSTSLIDFISITASYTSGTL